MWRWDQGRLLYFQFDVLRDIAKTLVKFDNADISKCENLLKKYYKKVNPNPICCACGADMSKRYPWTDYMLDIHHLLPLSSAVAISSSGTSLADIVGLCPSCHRAVHMYYRKWLRANEQADFKSKQEAHDVFVQATKEIA